MPIAYDYYCQVPYQVLGIMWQEGIVADFGITRSSAGDTNIKKFPTENNQCSNRAKYRILAGHGRRAHPFAVEEVVRDLLYPRTN